MNSRSEQKNGINDVIMKKIVEAVNDLNYGEVKIIVHNSRIVQIEKLEKTRFDNIWLEEKGGGI